MLDYGPDTYIFVNHGLALFYLQQPLQRSCTTDNFGAWIGKGVAGLMLTIVNAFL
jgi:hypothetical protein